MSRFKCGSWRSSCCNWLHCNSINRTYMFQWYVETRTQGLMAHPSWSVNLGLSVLLIQSLFSASSRPLLMCLICEEDDSASAIGLCNLGSSCMPHSRRGQFRLAIGLCNSASSCVPQSASAIGLFSLSLGLFLDLHLCFWLTQTQCRPRKRPIEAEKKPNFNENDQFL